MITNIFKTPVFCVFVNSWRIFDRLSNWLNLSRILKLFTNWGTVNPIPSVIEKSIEVFLCCRLLHDFTCLGLFNRGKVKWFYRARVYIRLALIFNFYHDASSLIICLVSIISCLYVSSLFMLSSRWLSFSFRQNSIPLLTLKNGLVWKLWLIWPNFVLNRCWILPWSCV